MSIVLTRIAEPTILTPIPDLVTDGRLGVTFEIVPAGVGFFAGEVCQAHAVEAVEGIVYAVIAIVACLTVPVGKVDAFAVTAPLL